MSARSEIVAAVVEVCGLDGDALHDDSTLESLGIDSLDLLEIAMIVESNHDAEFDSAQFEGVTTFGGAVTVFDRLLESSGT